MDRVTHLWVDADACPAVIKEILYRAAERTRRSMTLVANKMLRTPPSRYIRALQVPRGTGVRTGRPDAIGITDRKRFADQLDRFLAKQGKA